MSYESVVLADSPSFLWPLNETTGTTAADATGNSNTGTYTGGYTLDGGAGPVAGSGAVLLNGTSGYISSSVSPSVTAFSVEFWVNLNGETQGSFPRFISNYTGTSGLEVLTESGDLTLLFYTSSQQGYGTSTVLAAAGWQYVVMTYDGSSLISAYLNAASIGSNTQSGTYTPGSQGLLAGANPGGSGFVAGLMAWVAVYPTALTGTQVANHYNAAFTAPSSPAPLLIPPGRQSPAAWARLQPPYAAGARALPPPPGSRQAPGPRSPRHLRSPLST